jgi:uncharacterized protein YajQ (UPF0234 family)
MAEEFSFDVVSKVDLQVIEDCVHIAMKEITNRFDFKGSISRIEFDKKAATLTLLSEDEYKLNSVYDILTTRLAKRGAPLKNLERGKVEAAAGATARQVVTIKQGIPSDKAKEMVAAIKQAKLKVQASIQSDQLRISSRAKDELQNAIALLKRQDWGLELQFTNYR